MRELHAVHTAKSRVSMTKIPNRFTSSSVNDKNHSLRQKFLVSLRIKICGQ